MNGHKFLALSGMKVMSGKARKNMMSAKPRQNRYFLTSLFWLLRILSIVRKKIDIMPWGLLMIRGFCIFPLPYVRRIHYLELFLRELWREW
jgi:hypothetical protein